MKYLKTYENFKEIKKYVLLKANSNIYFILEVIDIKKDYIETKKLYYYTKVFDKLIKQYAWFNLRPDDSDIIYQSDNLKDVKNILLTLNDTETYNL